MRPVLLCVRSTPAVRRRIGHELARKCLRLARHRTRPRDDAALDQIALAVIADRHLLNRYAAGTTEIRASRIRRFACAMSGAQCGTRG